MLDVAESENGISAIPSAIRDPRGLGAPEYVALPITESQPALFAISILAESFDAAVAPPGTFPVRSKSRCQPSIALSAMLLAATVLMPTELHAADQAPGEPGATSKEDEIERRIREMEERHRKEIDALRAELGASSARSDEKTEDPDEQALQERVAAVEGTVEFIADEQVNLARQLQSMIDFDFYATLEYESFANANSTFDARNIELLIHAELTGRLRAGAEIEFERTAKTSGNSARTGDVEVEQGWLEYVIDESLKPRFGVLLVPFGKFNLVHFDPVQELTDRPIVMRRIVPGTWSEAGLGLSGELTFGTRASGDSKAGTTIHYWAYVMNGLTNVMSDTGLRDARGGFGTDNNNNKAFVGRVAVLPQSRLEFGLSGYLGEYDPAGDHEITGIALDFDYVWRNFQFLAEYARFDLDNGVAADGITVVPDSYYGYYLQTNYRFWPAVLNETFLGRDFSNPALTAVFRYDMAHIDDDGDAGIGDNEEKRWTIGLNYRPSKTFALKFEYQWNDTRNEALEHGSRDGFLFSATAAF